MTTNDLAQSIEAILFATAEPQTFSSLAERLETSKQNIVDAIGALEATLEGHGITLVLHNESATLATRSEQATLIEKIRKEELNRELSKASAETLAIVAYYSGATKNQIEFIRGVNATYSLRALQIRGLIEQHGAGRSVSYHLTLEALEHFGVSRIEQLPDFPEISLKIKNLLQKEEEAVS